MEVNLHRFLPYTTSEGPGKRACIWVQGCPIHCKGCGVPWTWNPNKGTLTSIDSLWEEILKSKDEHDIEGITFLGGEPFEQAEALGILAKRAQEIGLSVMTFSGYYKEQLAELNKTGWEELLHATDLFIDGPYDVNKPDRERPWIGSTNQRIHFLTNRYLSIEQEIIAIPNRLEIYIKNDGTIEANGMVPSETWKRILQDL